MAFSDDEQRYMELTGQMGIDRPLLGAREIIENLSGSKEDVLSIVALFEVGEGLRVRCDVGPTADPRMKAVQAILGDLFDPSLREEEMLERFEGVSRGLMDVVSKQRAVRKAKAQ